MSADKDSPPLKLGLVAGYGAFPLELASSLRQQGVEVHAVAAREETSQEIEQYANSTCWLHVGQLGGMIRAFKAAAIDKVILAGKVHKLHLFRNFRPDLTALKALLRLPDRKDDTILQAVADELAKEGIEVLSQTAYAGDLLAREGHLCGPRLDRNAWRDIDFGIMHARGIAGLDIGQTVVIQDQSVLAVEAIEGTDAAIERGGHLGKGQAIVVKVAKPNQDERFDVPAVGPDTANTMAAAGCRILAIEAGKTLILQRNQFFELAKKHNISVVGFGS